GGGDQAGLSVPPPVGHAQLVPPPPLPRRLLGDRDRVRQGGLDLVVGRGVLAHHPLVGLGVPGVPLVRADHLGQLGGAPIGGRGHQRGDRRRQRPPVLRVVRQPTG